MTHDEYEELLNDQALGVCMEFIKSLEMLRDMAKEITPDNKDKIIDMMDDLISAHADNVSKVWG